MDRVNRVPRKIDRREAIKGAHAHYWEYSFTGTGLSLLEDELRPLTEKEYGADWHRL
jgi:hypothetical protein